MIRAKKRNRVIVAVFGIAAVIVFNPISVLCWYPNDDDHAATVLRKAEAKVRRTPRLLWLSAHTGMDLFPYGDVWDVEIDNVTIDSNLASNITPLRSLEHLHIGNCRIEDSCTDIGPRENKLRILFIGKSNVGDRHIVFLANSPSIQFIMLEHTELSDESVPIILSCKRLTYVVLKNNKFSPEGIQRIRAGFPKANVKSE